jgi:hypothetical protein
MSDGEALEELAASIYYLDRAREEAESEEVIEVLDESLEFMDQTVNEVLTVIGEERYNDGSS